MTPVRLLRCVVLVALLATAPSVRAATQPHEILRLLGAQVEAWNRGDIDGFMQTYAQTDELRFASGDTVTYGWKSTLERYHHRYPDRAAMGTLAFSDLVVTELGADSALVFGRWQLTRAKDQPHGLFTLLVRRTPAGWRIFADHTSAAQ